MGYDLYLRGEPSAADQEAFRLASITYEAALAEREALPKSEQGQHITEATKARFEADPEGTKAESTAMFEAKLAKAEELEKQGIDFFLANQMAGEVPPTERYIEVQKRVLAAADARSDADKSYYRLNIWGMGHCRELMVTLDMVKEGETSWPDFEGASDEAREALDYVWDEADQPTTVEALTDALQKRRAGEGNFNEYYGDVTISDDDVAAYLKWRVAHEGALSAHDPSVPGIAIQKLCSNDGWIVTKEECASAVGIWESHSPDTQAATVASSGWWPSWIEFLRAGAEADGFSVH